MEEKKKKVKRPKFPKHLLEWQRGRGRKANRKSERWKILSLVAYEKRRVQSWGYDQRRCRQPPDSFEKNTKGRREAYSEGRNGLSSFFRHRYVTPVFVLQSLILTHEKGKMLKERERRKNRHICKYTFSPYQWEPGGYLLATYLPVFVLGTYPPVFVLRTYLLTYSPVFAWVYALVSNESQPVCI